MNTPVEDRRDAAADDLRDVAADDLRVTPSGVGARVVVWVCVGDMGMAGDTGCSARTVTLEGITSAPCLGWAAK